MSASATELLPPAFAHLAPMTHSGINRRVFPAGKKLSTAQNALTCLLHVQRVRLPTSSTQPTRHASAQLVTTTTALVVIESKIVLLASTTTAEVTLASLVVLIVVHVMTLLAPAQTVTLISLSWMLLPHLKAALTPVPLQLKSTLLHKEPQPYAGAHHSQNLD